MAPLDGSSVQPVENNFELLCSMKCNNLIPVSKYRSPRTGLTVVIASVEGPVVKGYFTVATESPDDDGLPHTLEHLIFMGSEQYPFKGLLDLFANRCLASGTNAWTDTDHTCYTMMTAGSEGFLTLMPIYVDHLLYPLLTDSSFITEVHHVSGKGEDGGVVYCEMQGCENSGESLSHLEMKRELYPAPSLYRNSEGGIMKNLRETCSNEKVRSYHKKYYRPENLTLIITGQVKAEDVFNALAPIESKILSKGERGPFERPWQSPVPEVPASVDKEILYSCDDEDNGSVFVAWRGPSAVTDLEGITACCLLLKYLTDTAASPLQKDFGECEDPCASDVSFSLAENKEAMMYIMFSNVPLVKLNIVKEKMDAKLQKIANKEEPFDIQRIRTVVYRHRQETLSHLETNPHDAVAFMLIGDMLYGNSKEDLYERLNCIESLDKLAAADESFWLNLLKQYFIENKSVTIRGRPSLEERQRISNEEQERIAKQIKDLGADGLKKKEQELEAAIAHNEIPPPDCMLRSVEIPDTSSIQFHPMERYTSKSTKYHPNLPLDKIPIYVQADHVHSNFVYMYLLMDTTSVSAKLRPYLSLLTEALLELPSQDNGKVIPYEEVVAELERITVSCHSSIGISKRARFQCGAFGATAVLSIQCEPSKFDKGVQWLSKLLYKSVLDAARLKIIATRMVNDVPSLKRSGHNMNHALMKGLRYKKDSNQYTQSVIRQQKFLSAVIEKLGSEEETKTVLGDLEEVRQIISSPKNVVLHMAANFDELPAAIQGDNVVDILCNLIPPEKSPVVSELNVTPDWKFVQAPSEMAVKNCVVGMGCVESAFLCQTVPCLIDPLDGDLPALLVFLQYVSQLEGPMWKQIRGQGFAYSYSVNPSTVDGMLYLTLYRASNLIAAYKEARNILVSYAKPGAKFEQTSVESARSSLIFEIINEEKSVGKLVEQSIMWYFKGLDHSYNSNLVKKISNVSAEDMARVAPKYVLPLFESHSSCASLVVHLSKTQEAAAAFKELDITLHEYPSLEETFLAKW